MPADSQAALQGPGLDDDLLAGLGAGAAIESAQERQARASAAAVAKPIPQLEPVAGQPPVAARRGAVSLGSYVIALGRVLFGRNWAGRMCLFAIALGTTFVFLGFHEFRLRAESSDVATTMTCAEFQAAASIPNRHIMLTDFVLLPNYVYKENWGRMTGAYVPAIPAEWVQERLAIAFKVTVDKLDTIPIEERLEAANKLQSRDFVWKTLISFPNPGSEAQLDREFERETLDGMYISKGFSSFRSDEQRLLKDAYPSVDLNNCMILVAGRTRASAAGATAMIAGGLAAAVCGLGFAIRLAMLESVA